MTLQVTRKRAQVLACASFLLAPLAASANLCASTARLPVRDGRIAAAVEEARRQHQFFGGQTIERNGGMFRVGQQEADSTRGSADSPATWERVATFWRAVSESDPPALMTSVGRVVRAEAAPGAAGGSRAEVAVREALLRAAILDTPWSAAFISHLMKTAGFSRLEFEFSDRHADYVRAALATSEAEREGRDATHAFRACDAARTRPRAGDLLCATRATSAGTVTFDALASEMRARASGQGFPMHCDIVVRADEGGDAKLDTIGGNVLNSVTLSRMTLDARKVLSRSFVKPVGECARQPSACREHLSRRPWVVLLQFRD